MEPVQLMIVRSAERAEVVRANRIFTNELGLSQERLATKPLLDWIHPDDRHVLERAIEAGEGFARARHATGDLEWSPLEWEVRRHDDGVSVLGLRARESGVFAESLIPNVAPQAMLRATLEKIVLTLESKTDGLRSSILLVDAAREHVTNGAGPSLPAEYNAAVEGLRIGPTVGSCGTAAYWDIPVIVEDIATDPLWDKLRDAASLAGVQSCWSVPITARDGAETLGAMALYDVKPRTPTVHEMDLLTLTARMVGLTIERDRLEQELRDPNAAAQPVSTVSETG